MDNKQLKLLIQNYCRQLDKAISEVEALMPDKMKRRSKDILGREVERIPALNPIYDFRANLYDDIEELEEQ